jgi:flagellar basal-body rod protein FlgG
MRALSIAATGMLAQELNVEVISNNIANLNTTAFKRDRADFQDLLYQSVADVGTQTTAAGTIRPTGLQVGLGVKPGSVYKNNQQGALLKTENTFDIAIQGKGYFQVTDANGNIFYTRSGTFQSNETGVLVNSQGFTVDPTITVPQGVSTITINEEGEVLATTDAAVAPTNLGRLTLVNFINEAGLRSVGNNNMQETDASGTPLPSNPGEDGYGTVLQGYLEASNVESVTEITNLITAQRAYEMNSKVITTADEMMQAVNNA